MIRGAKYSSLIKDFNELLLQAFPDSNVQILTDHESAEVLTRKKFKGDHPMVVWDSKLKRMVIFFNHESSTKAFAIDSSSHADISHQDPDFKLCDSLSKVFYDDLLLFQNNKTLGDTWITLRETQFRRAISRFFSFPPPKMSSWLRILESAASLTYETKIAKFSILFVENKEKSTNLLKKYMVPLSPSVPIKQLIIQEKWVRKVVDGYKAALLCNRFGEISSFLSLAAVSPNIFQKVEQYAPHESLLPLFALMKPYDVAYIASGRGDFYLATRKNFAFHYVKGKWHFENYFRIEQQLYQFIPPSLVQDILRLTIDLSYERKGSLLLVPDARKLDIEKLVTDYKSEKKPNKILRDSIRKLNVKKRDARNVISAAAAVDGATIISRDGTVIDVACMITPANTPPPPDVVGARDRAAWSASHHGTAIKVSEDGPIHVWKKGKKIITLE